MEVRDLHPWPSTPEEAEAIQDRLRPMLELGVPGPANPRTVAGLDVSYAGDGGGTGARLAAAVVVLDAAALDVVEESVAVGTAAFPYVPGLFAFRELPTLLDALRALDTTPDLLVCDGFGVAHPRRFGLACHLGVLTGLPAIGVGKTAFVGAYTTFSTMQVEILTLAEGDHYGLAIGYAAASIAAGLAAIWMATAMVRRTRVLT